MAMLAGIMAISAPRLTRHLSGRTLNEEARRFLALTRFARSEAVSRSVLMELWLDTETGEYGLKPVVEYTDTGKEPVEFQLADDMRFEVNVDEINEEGKATILFWPDGAIDEESLDELSILKGETDTITIEQTDFALGYRVKDEEENE
jgi:hypothetical protein